MMKVKQSTMVQPAKETPKHTLRSSILDLLVPNYHVKTVYFYKPNGSPNFFDPHLVKEALSNCLVTFYPVAGRLKRGGDGRYDIDCNGEGVLFVEAESEALIDDFGDFTPCLQLVQLIPTVDDSDGTLSYPLVMVQVTYFKCGGVCLGVGWHHKLADGISAMHFINTWSDMASGNSVTVPPLFDRSLVSARDLPSPTFYHTEYDPPPSMNTPPVQTRECQSTPTTAILKITLDQLNTLKANSKNDHNTRRYTTYETLAAHVWRCACISRGLGDDQATKLFIAIDGRSRLHPPLPPGTFSNIQFIATPVALSGDLTSQPLKSVAERIRSALSRMDDEYLRSALDYLALQPDPTALMRGAHSYKCPNLNVVSWSRMRVHDADFGWGRPIHMGRAGPPFEGHSCISRSPSGDGRLLLVICLEADHMEVFKRVFYDF